MLAHIIVLSHVMVHQVHGSRLGVPQNAGDKPTGWAWKDSDHHKPPGHLAKHKHSDGSHAWAGKARQPWKAEMPDSDIVDVPNSVNGGIPRKVIRSKTEDDIRAESVVKDSVTAKYDTSSEITSSSETNSDLQGTLEADCADSMNLAEFMPKCLKHTKSLIADLDWNYGDAQLETILRNWCQSAKEFPNARGTRKVIGFRSHQSCTDFADDLKNARYSELKTSSDEGYREFCSAFYGHHGGFVAQSPPRKKEPVYSGACWRGFSMVMLVPMMLFGWGM